MFLIHDGELTVGGLIACVMLSSRAMAPLVQVAQLLTRFHRSMVSLRALDAIMKSPVERPPGKEFLHRPELKGAVSFQDLRFAYPGHDIEALKGISFTIKAGDGAVVISKSRVFTHGKSTITEDYLAAAKVEGEIYDEVEALKADGAEAPGLQAAEKRLGAAAKKASKLRSKLLSKRTRKMLQQLRRTQRSRVPIRR